MGGNQEFGQQVRSVNDYDDEPPFTKTFEFKGDTYTGISEFAMNCDSFQESIYKTVRKHEKDIKKINQRLNLPHEASLILGKDTPRLVGNKLRRLAALNPPPVVQATFSKCEVLLILVAGLALNFLVLGVLYYVTRDRQAAKQRYSSRDSTWSAVVNRML